MNLVVNKFIFRIEKRKKYIFFIIYFAYLHSNAFNFIIFLFIIFLY